MTRHVFILAASLTIAAACGRNDQDAFTEVSGDMETRSPASSAEARPMVHVTLAPTAGHKAAGMLMFSETSDGVEVTGNLTGLNPDAEHGFHVHETGDCSAPDASSAGEHFNPTAQAHGDPRGDTHHLGDMVNLDVNDAGQAEVDVTLDGLRLTGPAERSVHNRAVIVHAQADDYKTQPSGNSGDRIACGVVVVEAVR
jgi:Cu-Zn family superoxide dismutase